MCLWHLSSANQRNYTRKCGSPTRQQLYHHFSKKLMIFKECLRTYLSFLSLTAFTKDLKLSSPMHLYQWSSHSNTLFIGNFGCEPPPTKAKMLHLKSISTIPIPPSNSIHQQIKALVIASVTLTSLEGVFKRIGIVNFKAFLGSTSKASLVLIEPDVQDFIFISHHFREILIYKII